MAELSRSYRRISYVRSEPGRSEWLDQRAKRTAAILSLIFLATLMHNIRATQYPRAGKPERGSGGKCSSARSGHSGRHRGPCGSHVR